MSTKKKFNKTYLSFFILPCIFLGSALIKAREYANQEDQKTKNIGGSAFGFVDYRFYEQLNLWIDLRYFRQNKSVLRTGLGKYYEARSLNFALNYQF